jgi:heat shock protein HtpX
MWNQIKTILLIGVLTGLVLALGQLLGGREGLIIALGFAIVLNGIMYFFSDKIVLAMYSAKPMKKTDYPWLHKMVEDIAHQAGIPKPKLYLVPTQTPNAFATGRSPKNAVVACTEGILHLLDREELRGVLAHELSHVKNRDMLVTTIAATLAAVISTVARMALWTGGDRDRGIHPIALIFLVIITPLVALLLQLAVSRSREYLADETGAKTIKNPKTLADALAKLEHGNKIHPMRHANPATSSLFIVNPFTTQGLLAAFSTHPPLKERIRRLNEMKI